MGTGGAKNSQDVIAQLNNLIFVCPICLHLARVTDAARLTGQDQIIAPGTGCSGNHHDGRRYRADKHLPILTKHIQAIAEGTMTLVRSPHGMQTSELAKRLRPKPNSSLQATLKRLLETTPPY